MTESDWTQDAGAQMNIQEAIKAHTDWKIRLHLYLHGENQVRLDPTAIRVDNACALGQWLYSEAMSKRFGLIPEYANLKNAHARFHKAAAAIVAKANSGANEEARRLLNENTGEFQRETINVILNLQKLARTGS